MLTLREPISAGDLPRAVTMPSGCVLHDHVDWHSDADGDLHLASATIANGGPFISDGGIDVSLTNLHFERPDGGVETLKDMHLQLPLTEAR